MPRNEDLDAVLGELAEVGIRDVTVAHGSKHLQVRWTHNGEPRFQSVAVSPSDWRSVRNARAEIRRQLKLDKLIPEPSAPRPSKQAPCWRERVESLARQLAQTPFPAERAVERAMIVAALRQLADDHGDLTAVCNGKEVVAG